MLKSIGLLLIWTIFPVLANTVVSVATPPVIPNVGDTFDVNIEITGANDLYAFQMDLNYVPTVLAAESVTEGSFLPSGGTTFFIPGTIDNVGGSVAGTADTLIGAISGVNGNGALLTVQFTALAKGTSFLTIANPLLLDSSLDDITGNATFVGGSVLVVPEPVIFAPCAILLALMAICRLYFARRPGRETSPG